MNTIYDYMTGKTHRYKKILQTKSLPRDKNTFQGYLSRTLVDTMVSWCKKSFNNWIICE